MTEASRLGKRPFWHLRSIQRKVSALFLVFGAVLLALYTIQNLLNQQLIVHPVWRELLASTTAQYLSDTRPPALKQLPAQGLIRGWRLDGGPPPSGMPALFARLAPGYYDEEAVADLGLDKSYSVLVTPIAAERIVMAVEIEELEDYQNAISLVSGLSALLSAIVIVGSMVWVFDSVRRPVQALAQRMDTLDPEQPAQRLDTDFELSELHDIAVVVNRHLERVERFIERERGLLDQASHEFRTPVAVIAGAVDVLKLHDLPPAAQAPLGRIQSSTDSLGAIMAALLYLSREPDGKAPVETTRLDALVTALVDDHAYLLAGKEATFQVGVLQPLWVGSPEAIVRIVVGNLLRNAAENSWQGTIAVNLHGECLSIQDSGPGFDTAAAARRYTQALRNSTKLGGGQGLGLFLTRRVCERFGWTLIMSSDASRGTLAELRFPAPAPGAAGTPLSTRPAR